MLRDIVRSISTGIKEINFTGINVGLVDERGEIAALYKGIPQKDIGIRTDVIDNIPKALGMKMLVRSMSPKAIIADEIGSKEDIEAIEYAVSSGVNGIFTAHGDSKKELMKNPVLKELLNEQLIEKVIFIKSDRSIEVA